VTRQERLADARTFAGYRSAHFARSTGTLVVVVGTEEQGLDPEGGGPWTTICDDHGTICQHETLRLARYFAPCPEEWCEDCMDVDHDRQRSPS
jgi:hypothetical protein